MDLGSVKWFPFFKLLVNSWMCVCVFVDDTTSTAIMSFLCGVVVSEHTEGFGLMETLEWEGKDEQCLFFLPLFLFPVYYVRGGVFSLSFFSSISQYFKAM